MHLPTDTLHSPLEIVRDISITITRWARRHDCLHDAAVQYAVWKNNMEDFMKAQWQDQYKFMRLSHRSARMCTS